jgi:hypothetical protein
MNREWSLWEVPWNLDAYLIVYIFSLKILLLMEGRITPDVLCYYYCFNYWYYYVSHINHK